MSCETQLKNLIHANGPLTVAQFMQIAVEHYYSNCDPFGEEGDFTTAPEISQMFGEMVGAWCAAYWEAMGSPDQIALVELGPGHGTLMQDIIRATKHAPGFHDAITIHLVENSPALRDKQQEALKDSGIETHWHDQFSDIPEQPCLVIANEFFDALPIHQFVMTEGGWRERMVALDDKEQFSFSLSPAITLTTALIPEDRKNAPQDAILEISPASIAICQNIADHITTHGGAALFIDYGYDTPGYKETLQAVKHHQYHPILENIGEADLTAHVDFTTLATAAEETGAKTYGPITQGDFLKNLGIETRAHMLMENANETQCADITAALERLTSPEQMGSLFKCLSLTHSEGPPPYGF